MLEKNCNRYVYFNADMIEVNEMLNWPPQLIMTLSKHATECHSDLKCPECGFGSFAQDVIDGGQIECQAELFDSVRFLRSMKLTRALQIKQRLKKEMENNSSSRFKMGSIAAAAATTSSSVFSNTQSSVFFTQNDAEYFAVTQQMHHPINNSSAIVDKSQYAKLNSILDALEHTGYYGFVTFIGHVQCVMSVNALSSMMMPTQQPQRSQISTEPTTQQPFVRTQSSTQCLKNK